MSRRYYSLDEFNAGYQVSHLPVGVSYETLKKLQLMLDAISTEGDLTLVVPSINGQSSGPTTNVFNSGYSSAIGDLVCLDSAGLWQLGDANTIALYNGLLGIALEVKASGESLLVALPGSFVYSTAFPALTAGSPVYMSETPGAITLTQPTTTDAAVRMIGWAVHGSKIYFNPSADYVTHV